MFVHFGLQFGKIIQICQEIRDDGVRYIYIKVSKIRLFPALLTQQRHYKEYIVIMYKICIVYVLIQKKSKMKKPDVIQVVLNIVAFLVLLATPGGNGSFWGFLTFNIMSAIVLAEILLSKDQTAKWLWITKTFTYVILCIKFIHSMGVIRWEYPVMIAIAILTLIVSRHLIKRRAVAMWGQNAAYLLGEYLYCLAILNHPDSFGVYHIVFWLINALSFGLVVYQVIKEKEGNIKLIVPAWAFAACLVYIGFIIAVSIWP